MKSKIFWIVELKVKESNLNLITTFMNDVFNAAVNDEKGTLSNEWFFSDDMTTCHMIDRYKSNDDVLAHLKIFDANFNERFNKYFELERFVVYGSPNEEVKEAVKGFNPIYMQHFGGFEK